jgi:hypothetical protein
MEKVMTAEQARNGTQYMTVEDMFAFFRQIGEEISRIGEEIRQNAAKTDAQMAKTDAQIARTDVQMRQMAAKTDAQMAKTDAQMAKTDARIAKLAEEVEKTTRNVGGINNSLGDLMEHMFSAQVWDKFDEYGYDFTQGNRDVKFREGKKGNLIAEADIFLENGDYAMAVEVKLDIIQEDIDEHIERMEKIRAYMDRREDKRVLVGAVAAGIMPDNLRRYAEKKGFYVLVQSGGSVKIAEDPDKFHAKEW